MYRGDVLLKKSYKIPKIPKEMPRIINRKWWEKLVIG